MAGLSVIVFGAFVALAHYQTGVKVTHDTQNVIFMSITLVPAASCVLSAIPFWFYRLGGDAKQQAQNPS
jgi:Na+/melibiose symporter-like transporter